MSAKFRRGWLGDEGELSFPWHAPSPQGVERRELFKSPSQQTNLQSWEETVSVSPFIFLPYL